MVTERKKRASLVWRILIVLSAGMVVIVLVTHFWMRYESYQHSEMFSELKLGMSKNEVVSIVGLPMSVDSTWGEYDVWRFQAPSLYSSQPHCYFERGDSILVKYHHESLGIRLPNEPDTAH